MLELPDSNSWHYLVYLETCKYCEEGGADTRGKMLRDGETKLDGKLPQEPQRRLFLPRRGPFSPGPVAGHRVRQPAQRTLRRSPGQGSQSRHGPDLRFDGQQRNHHYEHLKLHHRIQVF